MQATLMLMLMLSLKGTFARPGRAHFRSYFARLYVTFIAFSRLLLSFQWHRARPCTEHKNNGAHIDPYRRDDLMADCLFY